MLTINMDDEVKKEFQDVVNKLGLNATSAVNLFARAVIREKAIPFPITLRTREEQDWNDYLSGTIEKSCEDLRRGDIITEEELERLIDQNKAS